MYVDLLSSVIGLRGRSSNGAHEMRKAEHPCQQCHHETKLQYTVPTVVTRARHFFSLPLVKLSVDNLLDYSQLFRNIATL